MENFSEEYQIHIKDQFVASSQEMEKLALEAVKKIEDDEEIDGEELLEKIRRAHNQMSDQAVRLALVHNIPFE